MKSESMELERNSFFNPFSEAARARLLSGSCTDNGPDIPEEIRAHAFEPFVTCGKRQGTGLGMAIAKTIVETHGGTISFVTGSGRGTAFIISLPRGEAHDG
ncbi:MAG: HAMP domain-containing sensor histidine kinase [Candidatus Aureabacteria bacterium]|nr:HAMP domain-containing sensor histidine kinase [Candidatus Auribacterota bacterium]